jgi:hypothetical protein
MRPHKTKAQLVAAIANLHQVSLLVAECIYDAYKLEQYQSKDPDTRTNMVKVRSILDDCYPKED